MKDVRAHRSAHQCVLPPYILESIARNGGSSDRNRAIRNLSVDQSVRVSRVIQALAPAIQAGEPEITTPVKKRTIADAKNSTMLPGHTIRREGAEPTDDVTVNEAYDGLGATFDFYLSNYDRNSINNRGLTLRATVHYDEDYDNAFWNGQRMIFGDGDGTYFNRFTISLDVIGHELTHGVTGSERNLEYQGQSGALNESVSDVFGSLVKQYSQPTPQTTDQADWLIGAGLFTAQVQGTALRSMKQPGTGFDDPVLGKDPQPAVMTDYVDTASDNGGVHINSGIPNRAFYLVASGFGGYAWEKAGKIWYETIRDESLPSTATFKQFAAVTVSQAETLFDAAAKDIVTSAWSQVGVL
jgi:Zn-dependent metalloprotease